MVAERGLSGSSASERMKRVDERQPANHEENPTRRLAHRPRDGDPEHARDRGHDERRARARLGDARGSFPRLLVGAMEEVPHVPLEPPIRRDRGRSSGRCRSGRPRRSRRRTGRGSSSPPPPSRRRASRSGVRRQRVPRLRPVVRGEIGDPEHVPGGGDLEPDPLVILAQADEPIRLRGHPRLPERPCDQLSRPVLRDGVHQVRRAGGVVRAAAGEGREGDDTMNQAHAALAYLRSRR